MGWSGRDGGACLLGRAGGGPGGRRLRRGIQRREGGGLGERGSPERHPGPAPGRASFRHLRGEAAVGRPHSGARRAAGGLAVDRGRLSVGGPGGARGRRALEGLLDEPRNIRRGRVGRGAHALAGGGALGYPERPSRQRAGGIRSGRSAVPCDRLEGPISLTHRRRPSVAVLVFRRAPASISRRLLLAGAGPWGSLGAGDLEVAWVRPLSDLSQSGPSRRSAGPVGQLWLGSSVRWHGQRLGGAGPPPPLAPTPTQAAGSLPVGALGRPRPPGGPSGRVGAQVYPAGGAAS